MKNICIAIALAFVLLLSGCTFNVYNPPAPSTGQPPATFPPVVPVGAQPNETSTPPVPPAAPENTTVALPTPPAPLANASVPAANESVPPVPDQPPAANASVPAANASNFTFNFSISKWWKNNFGSSLFLNLTIANNTTAPFAFTLVQIDGETSMAELDDAASKLTSLEKSGAGKPGQITVRQLLQAGEFDLASWRQDLTVNSNLVRKDVVVMFLDSDYEPVKRWCFSHAWPSGFYLGGLDSQSAIYEYYVLDYEDARNCE
jgi:hypothetical protein